MGDLRGSSAAAHPISKITITIESLGMTETFTIDRAVNVEMSTEPVDWLDLPGSSDPFVRTRSVEKLSFSFLPLADEETGVTYRHQVVGPEMVEQPGE